MMARFGHTLKGPNYNEIISNDVEDVNNLVHSIFNNDDLDEVQEKSKTIRGTKHGLTSIFYYLKDNDAYNIYLPITVQGLVELYPEYSDEIDYDGELKENYTKYNEACNDFKQEYSIKPQELELILSVISDKNYNNKHYDALIDDANVSFWIEKTLVKGRPDREEGPYALGRVLWSPQADSGGNRWVYDIMTEPEPGDRRNQCDVY
ncbi:hypothetical protein GF326_10815 [Candidatus Bathyarchaeota archaeon]|nr:hypothetical protein [Candidatus Bathyarchaeota archaeon]